MKIIQINSLDELLSRINDEESGFKVMAGGTDIMPKYYKTGEGPEVVFDLSPLEAGLNSIKENGGGVEIGALATLTEVGANKIIAERIPQLAKAVNSVGSRMVRNMGTLAGNIANASPVADSACVLLTTEAILNLKSINGERNVPMTEFFLDYKKTALNNNEIIISVNVPFNQAEGKYGFDKVAVRPEMIMAKLNFAYALLPGSVRFATGGMAKMPVRLRQTESAFKENPKRNDWVEVLAKEVTPISDIRSTKEYRLKVLANLIGELGQSFPG